MDKPKIDPVNDIVFDESKDLAGVEIANGDAKAIALFDPEHLSDFINALLSIRERMKKQFPRNPPGQGEQTLGVNDPAWSANLATMSETQEHKPQILIRHPGLGWRSYYLKADEARTMAKALTDLAEMADKKGVKIH